MANKNGGSPEPARRCGRPPSSKWIWEEPTPQWWPGIYEGLTASEALAQVGQASEEEARGHHWLGM